MVRGVVLRQEDMRLDKSWFVPSDTPLRYHMDNEKQKPGWKTGQVSHERRMA
jgi:hypothetical protein